MSISTIGYWILESLEGIKKNSKTFLIGLGTMFVVLSLIGGLYILYLNAIAFFFFHTFFVFIWLAESKFIFK